MHMQRVFLGGTTAGTTWRQELIERLVARGVREEDQIVNPHLPKGVRYTTEHKFAERACKDDPGTIVLIHVCKGSGDVIGAISMFETAKYAYGHGYRTAIVFDPSGFDKDSRSYRTLEGLRDELRSDFFGMEPYFDTLAKAEDWIVEQLVRSPNA